jgi:hypothetical protein
MLQGRLTAHLRTGSALGGEPEHDFEDTGSGMANHDLIWP